MTANSLSLDTLEEGEQPETKPKAQTTPAPIDERRSSTHRGPKIEKKFMAYLPALK
jgi:hypothetical protein